MRIDKFICETTTLTRSEAKKAIQKGQVSCNLQAITHAGFQVPTNAKIYLNQVLLQKPQQQYFMLHKPINFICSTLDEHYPSALHLLHLKQRQPLHFAGRLDADATGLVLITNDGNWSHRITSPRRVCSKSYWVQLAEPIDPQLIQRFAQGIQLRQEKKITRPAQLEIASSTQVRLTITEGKYHQVKRMFAATGNKVIQLHRESIGSITLDPALKPGQWRALTATEKNSIA